MTEATEWRAELQKALDSRNPYTLTRVAKRILAAPPAPEPSEDAVERVAQALYAVDTAHVASSALAWPALDHVQQERYRIRARATLSASAPQGGEPCKPLPGEPSFVLLGRDPQAPDLVAQWARDREAAEPDAKQKVAGAIIIAGKMRRWKREHPEIGMSASKYAPPAAPADELVAALEPFAKLAEEWRSSRVRPKLTDGYPISGVTYGDLRRAARALARHRAQEESDDR